MKIAVHIHSEYSSDARQPVWRILEECRALGFDAVAITDHNTTAGSMAAAKTHHPGIEIIPGAEFSTNKGHILALFIDETVEKTCRPSKRERGREYDFDDLVKKVREQDGLLFLAHPLLSAAVEDHSFIALLDGYERINGRINSSHTNRQAQRLDAVLRSAHPQKATIGGSDAHTAAEIQSVFMTSDAADMKKALLEVDEIHFKKSSMAKIRFHNIKNNPSRSPKYHAKQCAAMAYGLCHDLGCKLKGDAYEVIRVRQKNQ